MGKKTSIGWTDHTFNPWWGCTHDGPECDRCYAELFAKRTGHNVWGHDAPRRFFGDLHWGEPLLWNRAAQAAGQRRRVFCASMADVGERLSNAEGEKMDAERRRLATLIGRTPWLNWLLLTKRPQNLPFLFPEFGSDHWPTNVWLGTTAGDEAGLQKRGKYLVRLRATVLFISHEPALGPVNLAPWIRAGVSWVITGGESGGKNVVRPYDPAWAESVITQCRSGGAAPFVKQMGSNPVGLKLNHIKGEDINEWPNHLRIQDFPL